MQYAFQSTMAEVMECKREDVPYQMRSVRCTIATEYLKVWAESKILKVDAPPNPLQHTDLKTTREHYAEMGADDLHEARKRLTERELI